VDEGAFDAFQRDQGVEAYDSASRYFRWEAQLDMDSAQEEIKQALTEEVKKGSGKVEVKSNDGAGLTDASNLGDYVNMSVEERNSAGIVTDLSIVFANGYADICHENTIRKILGLAMAGLTDKNGDSVYTLDMLPSAAISLEGSGNKTCQVYGGGLGHGIGMSQYGADGMAQAGMGYEEILELFFPGTEIVTAG
ncbi:MAG: hypothetical protein LUC83_07375, partial [Clostridiales bacterium]|nr:hypothetical protein [Clostridiales bacterium]